MDRWEREGLRSANNGIRNQVDDILDTLATQQAQLARVQAQVDAVRVTVTSADRLVEVTVDSAGVVTDVRFTAAAVRSTPEQLGRSTTEAAREAARQAHEQHRAIIAPLTDAADAMPDLSDLVPGASSLREPRDPTPEDL